ncbi:MAG: DUF368 domain-containing protein [Lysobacteraceae bacterium]|nr:MAG: DUF368 domain-containing protein [Xanthomonadaceae bacterium]
MTNQLQTERKRSVGDYAKISLRGVAMGAADVVPGVSGGTIAFISGIYEELIDSIRKVDVKALQMVVQGRIGDAWSHVNANFLLALLAGIVLAFISLANIIKHLLATQPVLVWGFFFGLVLSAAWVVSRSIKKFDTKTIASLVLGVGMGLAVALVPPGETPDSLLFIALCGAIAVTAMILPGISGSFLLLLMGKYEYMITALTELRLAVICSFIAGAVVGLLSFSRLLHLLLNRFHDLTVAFLTGIMLGSLAKVWPWKNTVMTYVDRHGVEKPLITNIVMPGQFEGESQVVLTVVLALIGAAIVLGLHWVAQRSAR